MALNKLIFQLSIFFLYTHETYLWVLAGSVIETLPASIHNKCFLYRKKRKKNRSNVGMLVICGFTIITLVEVDKIDKESKNNGHLIILCSKSLLW